MIDIAILQKKYNKRETKELKSQRGATTGTGSSCSAAQSDAPSCTCGGKTYSYTHTATPSNSDCSWACKNEGYDTGTSKGTSLSGTGSGSSCSTAKSNATSAWNDKFNGAVTTYCNCENNQTWRFTLYGQSCDTGNGCCGSNGLTTKIPYVYTIYNDCGSSGVGQFELHYSATREDGTTYNGTTQISLPSTGSGSGFINVPYNIKCNSHSIDLTKSHLNNICTAVSKSEAQCNCGR